LYASHPIGALPSGDQGIPLSIGDTLPSSVEDGAPPSLGLIAASGEMEEIPASPGSIVPSMEDMPPSLEDEGGGGVTALLEHATMQASAPNVAGAFMGRSVVHEGTEADVAAVQSFGRHPRANFR
jgi:hypothetical protein